MKISINKAIIKGSAISFLQKIHMRFTLSFSHPLLRVIFLSSVFLWAGGLSKGSSKNSLGVDLLFFDGDYGVEINYGALIASAQFAELGFYSRWGSENFRYHIPQICETLNSPGCTIQLSEYLWGFSLSYVYEMDLKWVKLQPKGGVKVLWNFNEGTALKERIWFPLPLGGALLIPFARGWGLSVGYSYWFHYETREPHHLKSGLSWEF